MKEDDPDYDIVDELHKIRWAICKKAGGTPADYFRHYLEMDREKVAAAKAAETAVSGKSKGAQSKSRLKLAKPGAKAPARKQGTRRKVVAP